MRDIDNMIEEALGQEEREILRRIGEEPGFFSQAFGLFRGPTGWVNVIMMVAQGVIFIAGVWAAWHFFQAGDPVSQLRWGLPAATLLILATILKMALLPRMETNHIIRELKRLELQLALKRD
ncbi:MAG TPA: DUF6768 family protein [Allosphingosinicella sp.]|jgi:hypothetical protein|nr:DUF6768 family protein [Allosphingosinicella sp.]